MIACLADAEQLFEQVGAILDAGDLKLAVAQLPMFGRVWRHDEKTAGRNDRQLEARQADVHLRPLGKARCAEVM